MSNQEIENKVVALLQAAHDNACSAEMGKVSVAEAIETGIANGVKARKRLYAKNRSSSDFAAWVTKVATTLDIETVQNALSPKQQQEEKEEQEETLMVS